MPSCQTVLPPVLAALAFLLLWQLLIVLFAWPAYMVPSPLAVARVFLSDFGPLADAGARTLLVALTALLLSALTGLLFALLLALQPFLGRAFYPYLIVFQAVPVITIAPLVVIWFGTGFLATVLIAWIASVVPVIANTVAGIRATPRPLLDLFRLQKRPSWQTFWHLRLPFALPYFFTGLRIAAGLAVVGAVIGEYMIGMGGQKGGLGFVIAESAARLEVPLLFAATFLSCLLGALFFVLVTVLEKQFLFWHASQP